MERKMEDLEYSRNITFQTNLKVRNKQSVTTAELMISRKQIAPVVNQSPL